MILELISFSLDIKNIETRSGRMQSAANTQWHIPLQKVGNFFNFSQQNCLLQVAAESQNSLNRHFASLRILFCWTQIVKWIFPLSGLWKSIVWVGSQRRNRWALTIFGNLLADLRPTLRNISRLKKYHLSTLWHLMIYRRTKHQSS